MTLLRSQSYLGAQYRRLRTRLGAPQAITAMARKLACLFYRLIKHGHPYVDKGTEYDEARYRVSDHHKSSFFGLRRRRATSFAPKAQSSVRSSAQPGNSVM